MVRKKEESVLCQICKGENLEKVRLTKRQIEVTMFAAGVGTLKGLKVGKLVE